MQLVDDIDRGSVVLPEFQRDFVWDVEKTFDLFDSLIKDIFVGSLIYGVPTFEITARELDTRPRSGKGSQRKLRLTDYSRTEIRKLVETQGFRLLLDGQQRATSIYRALKGVDPVYFNLFPEDELDPESRREAVSKRSIESVTKEIGSEPLIGHVCIKLSDVFAMLKGEMPREKNKVEAFIASSPALYEAADDALKAPEFNVYLTHSEHLQRLFQKEKLLAYYLLDTNEEKFALFFERSNSKGIQLSFIDILAAKLHRGFNLRLEVERFKEENPQLPLNREAIVRAISYVISGGKDTGRGFILGNLTHIDFTEHWPVFTEAYRKVYDYLFQNRLLIHQAWMSYDNMTIPLMVFVRQLPGRDFGQMSDMQRRIVQVWYWASVFARRYSRAAQTAVLEDAQNLEAVGEGDFSGVAEWLEKIHPMVKTREELLSVSKQYDAAYMGVLNLVHHVSSGLVNWQNGDRLSPASSLEDHHIFPKDYLKKRADEGENDPIKWTDCVVNRTLIPKIQNIKIGNKSPSRYLQELKEKNPRIEDALNAHLLPAELVSGLYDDMYEIFLDERADRIVRLIDEIVIQGKAQLVAELSRT